MAKPRKPRKASPAAPPAGGTPETVAAPAGEITQEQAPNGGGSPDVSRRERIALLAYGYWKQRGCPLGSPEEDWFRAERDIDRSPAD